MRKKEIKQQYPAQTGPYKVDIISKTAEWKDYEVARIQVSIRNPKHGGDKLESLLDWATGRFSKVIVVVSDTLIWPNIAFETGKTEEDAIALAREEGDKWLKKNSALEDKGLIIKRWDEWRLHESYEDNFSKILSIYNNNQDFQKIISNLSERVWSNRYKKFKQLAERHAEFIETSKQFLFYELSAFSIMFREETAIDIYPGTWFENVFDFLATLEDNRETLTCFQQKACLSVDFVRQ